MVAQTIKERITSFFFIIFATQPYSKDMNPIDKFTNIDAVYPTTDARRKI